MDSKSQKMLRRIEQNDVSCKAIKLGYSGIYNGRFNSSDASDYSRLGAAIGNNTHLTKLVVNPVQSPTLDIANNEFFDGLKRNSSINDLTLHCRNQTLVGGIGHEILRSYQKINNNLTCLYINNTVLDNGGCNVITETLRWCRNLKTINLSENSITDEQLLPMIEAIKGGCNTSLEELHLYSNMIGNAGCHALATLLADPHCSLQTLDLNNNQIGNEGATAIANSLANNTKVQTLYLQDNQIGTEGATTIANSLANNTKLKWLYLRRNPFDLSVDGSFCTVLCNTSSVNDTYHSNHTLVELALSDEQEEQDEDQVMSLLEMNWGTNKSHVAIKKILKYHPNIDMGPLFEWDAEGEQTLKALPFVIGWFGRAEEAVAGALGREDYHVEKKKLSAIFQFAKAMPLMFVPETETHIINIYSRKRKRGTA